MRKIKILSPGPIRAMGMVHGPILTPYTVDDAKLTALLKEGLNIVEILPDGEKTLTMNDVIGKKQEAPKTTPKAETPKVEEKVVEPEVVKEEAPVVEEPVETVEETPVVEESPVEEEAPVEEHTTDDRRNNNYKNKKRK